MAADEPTLGEVIRRFEDRFAVIRDDIQELGQSLDKKVDQRIYDLRHDALVSRINTLEMLREKDAEKLVATRRWLIGAVVVPLIAVLLPLIVLLMQGSGS